MAQELTASEKALVQAIQASGASPEVAAAMLVGATGESNQYQYASGSGGGGYFGFTPPYYPAYLETASPSTQVAAMLPAYEQSAAAGVPASVTDPAARAEYIALGAEKPGSKSVPGSQYYERQAAIAATNAPTLYGANVSYSVGNWPQIEKELAMIKTSSTSTASAASHPNAHTGKPKTSSDLTSPTSSPGSAGSSSAKKPTTTQTQQGTNPLTGWVQTLEKAKPFPTLGWSFLPWNWGEDAMNSVWADIVTWGIILGGIVIALYGLKVTMERGGGGGGGGGGSNITVQPTIERDVEHAGEVGAEGAALAA